MADYTLSDYHEHSKHHLNRYAPGPGGLDWANQPDPFRCYKGAARIELPLLADTLETRYSPLRCGTLHPTEGYLVTCSVPGLAAGVYHYVSRDHALERRGEWDGPVELNGLAIGFT